jgi:hypothetical protein
MLAISHLSDSEPQSREVQMNKRNHLMGRFCLLLALLLVLPAVNAHAAPALLLYAGPNHDRFLGCLNCSKYDNKSVWNKYGDYGSKYGAVSIWNKYSLYGSKYNLESPWNKYSTSAPVIVDAKGNYYGYFTTNKYLPQRTQIQWILWILDNYDWISDNFDQVAEKFL